MPHIVLEHNLEDEPRVSYICKKLHGALSRQETVKLESIKTRSIYVDNLSVGDAQNYTIFAHVTLKLLPGRSEELKHNMAQAFFDVLKSALKEGAFSVEVVDLQTYLK